MHANIQQSTATTVLTELTAWSTDALIWGQVKLGSYGVCELTTRTRTALPIIRHFGFPAEEVVQVYGICIRTLHLPVISVMIIGVMRLSYNERAVSEGRFRHHLFQAVFVRTSYPSRYVYFRWSRVHKAVETAVTATVVM